MGVYPKKRKVMSGRFGFDMAKVQEGMDAGKFDGISGITAGAGELVKNIGSTDMGYGVSYKGVGANTAGTALQGMGMGVEIGKNFGAPGLVIGAAAGLVGGAVKGLVSGKNEKEKAQKQFTINQSSAVNNGAKKSRAMYGQMGSYKAQSYEKGGRLNSEGKAVIMGGKLHKDGGNPIVFAENGKKIAETEREELLLTSKQSDDIEKLIALYDSKNLEVTLQKLGKLAHNILLNETIDNSGIYD